MTSIKEEELKKEIEEVFKKLEYHLRYVTNGNDKVGILNDFLKIRKIAEEAQQGIQEERERCLKIIDESTLNKSLQGKDFDYCGYSQDDLWEACQNFIKEQIELKQTLQETK